MKIAIIGSGISGLTCGYYLQHEHDVTLFEANNYVGGHTNTLDISHEGEQQAIDTGFIVFNDRTYPNFQRLLDGLSVAYQPTEMSFSVRNDNLGLEYNGHNLNTLFAQRRNLWKPAFWRLLKDITKFNQHVRECGRSDSELTIGDYLDQNPYGRLFADNYLLPMISAIWSMGLTESRAFPLALFVRFFENHGLLDLRNRPQWFTIKGGSREYIAPLTAGFADRIHLNTPVQSVRRTDDQAIVRTETGEQTYDHVIFACHGDTARALLRDPDDTESSVLSAFECTDNQAILHTDTRILPQRQKTWASWNYLLEKDRPETPSATADHQPVLTYHMNILQRLSSAHNYLVTLNHPIDASHVLASVNYRHPKFTTAMVEAQSRWREVSTLASRVHFCGAYWFNGFHEDGVRSALRVCQQLSDHAPELLLSGNAVPERVNS